MEKEKITKEMINTYLELHEKITDKLQEVLFILSKEDSENYKDVPFEYYKPDYNKFSVGGWDGCLGCYDWESESIPTHYLYDEDWLEQIKQKLKKKEEKEKQEKLIKEQKMKKEKEEQDKREYERLKEKFEKMN